MKITPKLRRRHKMVDFATLKDGDTFLYGPDNEDLCMKTDSIDQVGFRLDGTGQYEDMCGEEVVPVNAEINWSYNK